MKSLIELFMIIEVIAFFVLANVFDNTTWRIIGNILATINIFFMIWVDRRTLHKNDGQ